MVYCAVQPCTRKRKSSNYNRDGVSYFKFPTHPILFQKWSIFCGRDVDWKPTRTSAICSDHFDSSCIIIKGKNRRLIENAIPTILHIIISGQRLHLQGPPPATNQLLHSDGLQQLVHQEFQPQKSEIIVQQPFQPLESRQCIIQLLPPQEPQPNVYQTLCSQESEHSVIQLIPPHQPQPNVYQTFHPLEPKHSEIQLLHPQEPQPIIHQMIHPQPTYAPEAVAEDEEVGKVCRACLATGVRMVDVAAGGLQDTFEHVTGTELHTSDVRPRQVCYVCWSQLQRFRAFSQTSRTAETYMTQLVERGLQITEEAVSNRHTLIKPKLDVTKNPLIAIHTQEDPDECVPVEVKVEVKTELEDNNKSDSETENETEIKIEAKTTVSDREPSRENETEERQPDWEPEGEIKIEIDEIDIEEFDPFEAVKHTTASDENFYCIQCAEEFPSQIDLLKHIQNHTQQELKQGNASRLNVKAKGTKRNVTKLEFQCKFCNKKFAIKTQLVKHVAKEHGFSEFLEQDAQNPKRRRSNISTEINPV